MSISTKLKLALLPQLAYHRQIRNVTSLVRSITVRPSLRPYGELQVISPGKFKIPKKPFDLEVQYIDSSPYEPKKQTVVAIHGAPGSWHHFEAFARDFHESDLDIRFISLSQPDFTHTRKTGGYYWHTTPERVNFLRHFLADLKIDTVDSFVCHSFGTHTAVALWDNPENLKIKSLCLYAPSPLWDGNLRDDIEKVKKLFLFNNELWYNFLDKLKLYNNEKLPLKFGSTNEILLFCALAYDTMALTFGDRLTRAFQNSDIPLSIMYGAREKLISKKSMYRFNDIVGVPKNEIVTIDPNIHTDKDIVDNGQRVNSYMLEEAGHNLQLTHYKFAKQALLNLLAKL